MRPNSSHKVGLKPLSNYQAFFNYPLMQPVIARMPVIHINAPGREDQLSDDHCYPSIDQSALDGVKQAICVGVGAKVMARVAFRNPDLFDGSFLINPVPTGAGRIDWAHQRRNIYHLNNLQNTQTSAQRRATPTTTALRHLPRRYWTTCYGTTSEQPHRNATLV